MKTQTIIALKNPVAMEIDVMKCMVKSTDDSLHNELTESNTFECCLSNQ